MSLEVGSRFKTTGGDWLTVKEYRGAFEVIVEFDYKGYTTTAQADDIRRGKVKNWLIPSVYGVGVVGSRDIDRKIYCIWRQMLGRCYSRNTHPNYKDVTVEDSWHDYRNFKQWFDNQIYRDGWDLDKDLLIKGNKIYSKDTCVFIPHEINTFMLSCKKRRGKNPVGVCLKKRDNKFRAKAMLGGVERYLGVYNTPEEAFAVYKETKESYAKDLAQKWSGIISQEAYNALMNYKIEEQD